MKDRGKKWVLGVFAAGGIILDLVISGGRVLAAEPDVEATASTLSIVLDEKAGDAETRVANALRDRILRWSEVSVETGGQGKPEDDLRIYIGRAGSGGALDRLCETIGLRVPGETKPFAEGYTVKTADVEGKRSVVALGADQRGMLYAAGEILRQFVYEHSAVKCGEIDVSTAPAYRFRGSSLSQGATMMEITGSRPWTMEEQREYFFDLAFAGANCFYSGDAGFDYVKSFGLMTATGCRPNEYRESYPEEWQATERGPWVCPSIPEARKALLAYWEKDFAQRPNDDILRMFAGDPGGCRCARCEPWGKTFVELCEEVANIWLKHHPDGIVQIANQDLTNEGDQAIFDYLNEKPRTWLQGIAYGPGSNAMSPYFRSELREDLFEYPGSGPVNRYLAETLHQLPKYQTITHFSDISHWISAQYEVKTEEPHIARLYGRRTFHARPQAFYDIFQDIMPFSEGDLIYSEGYHDEFHQYMWDRLLWNPNRSIEDVVGEYCRVFFGPAAAPAMSDALFQLEKNLEAPLDTNEGIDRYYTLVTQGGEAIPAHFMAENHRWRLHKQKADMDKYFQLKLRAEREQLDRLTAALASTKDADARISDARAVLAQPVEPAEVAALREDAGKLGVESNDIFGVRDVGYFSAERSLTDLAWTAREIERAAAAPATERAAILDNAVGYDTVGEGSFYDDAGNPKRQVHLIEGVSRDISSRLDPENRLSATTIAYSRAEATGVVFRYSGLDPEASYKVKVTLVGPRYPKEPGDPAGPPRRFTNVVANGEVIARDVEIPEYTAKQFEFDVPQNLTKSGELVLAFERGTDTRMIAVSEVWLLKQK